MRIHLRHVRKRRYLRGNDWIICALDDLTRRTTGVGNLSQVVLHLAGRIAVDDLAMCLEECLAKCAAVWGRPARDWLNLAPYWSMRSLRSTRSPVRLSVDDIGAAGRNEDAVKHLAEAVNRGLPEERARVAFHLVSGPANSSFLGMTFDHCLLDARGAEMFLGVFDQQYAGRGDRGSDGCTALSEPAHLDNWVRKFRSGKVVNRAIRALAGLDLATLPIPRRPSGLRYGFRVEWFNETESTQILETAYRKAGYLMVMPHLLAATLRALHPVFHRRGSAGNEYIAVVTLDAREPATQHETLFFNHVDFMFFRIEARHVLDYGTVVESIKVQMYSQVKAGQPQHLENASLLMRILPLSAIGMLLRRPLRVLLGSFSFADVGKTAYTQSTFMGREVVNVFHMPRVAAPPGIGVFFNRFQSRVNVTLAYVETMLEDGDADRVVVRLRESLTGECDRVVNHGDPV